VRHASASPVPTLNTQHFPVISLIASNVDFLVDAPHHAPNYDSRLDWSMHAFYKEQFHHHAVRKKQVRLRYSSFSPRHAHNSELVFRWRRPFH
jgi:hypothetical protein